MVNEAFKQFVTEEADPALKIQRGIARYRKAGEDDGWVDTRVQGIGVHKALTSTMSDRNGREVGRFNLFAESARVVTLAVLGKTPREFKATRGLPGKARTRDHLDRHELARLHFAESDAEVLIK